MNELTAAVIGAVVGALFAFFGGWFYEIRDRRRRRKSLATALLGELRSAEVTLRGMYTRPHSFFGGNAFSIFEKTEEILDVFRPETVQKLLDFSSALDNVRSLTDHALSEDFPQTSVYRTALAVFTQAAVSRVPDLKIALEKDGGEYIPFIPPDIPSMESGQTEPPPLPSPAFKDIGRQIEGR